MYVYIQDSTCKKTKKFKIKFRIQNKRDYYWISLSFRNAKPTTNYVTFQVKWNFQKKKN